MMASVIRTLTFAGIALVLPTFSASAAPDCMIKDYYGRLHICGAFYKQQNPNWRASDQCYTDDGYGRYRSCSASYKRKQASQQNN